MNKLKFLTLCLVLAVSSFTLQSCNDDDDNGSTYFPNALVTLKTNVPSICSSTMPPRSYLPISRQPLMAARR